MANPTNDTLAVELIVDDQKATVKLNGFGQKIKLVSDDINKIGSSNSLAGKLTTDFDALSKRVEETRRQFQDFAKVRLDNGQIGSFTKEILTAQIHSRQLAADIVTIKKELANPDRTSSITLLTANLRAAEAEADRLDKKLSSLSGGAAQGGIGRGAANNLKLSGFQKQNLSYQINDVLTGFASGQNPTQILAQQGGQIAQIFDPKQITAFTAAYGGLVSILGVGAAAIALTYKITGDIRKEAEHNLEVQTKITGEFNKQRIAAKELEREFAEQRANAARSDNFSRSVSTDNLDQLNRRKQNLEQSIKQTKQIRDVLLLTSNRPEDLKKLDNSDANDQRELLDVESRLRKFSLERAAQSQKSFKQQNEAFKKSQQDAIEFEKKRAEETAKAEKKRLEDVEKAKEKVKELQRVYLETFSTLSTKLNSDNPFVSIFTDADKALKELRENIKGLPAELQRAAIEMQKKINLRQMLEAQVGNQLSAFDLRNDANNFRNPLDPEKQKLEEEQFIKRFLYNNRNYLYLKRQEYDQKNRVGGLQSFLPFEEEVKKDILSRGKAAFDNPANRLNKQLEDKYNLLYKPGQTAEQLAIADKRFIAATQGVNPLDLNRNLRESSAFVREREAARQEKYQTDALDVYKKQLAVQEKIEANTQANNKLAESGGTKAIEMKIKDERTGGNVELQQSATSIDTAAAYQDDTSFFSLLNPSTLK